MQTEISTPQGKNYGFMKVFNSAAPRVNKIENETQLLRTTFGTSNWQQITIPNNYEEFLRI